MKKITITAILAFIFAMATVSCEDDYGTRIPTFDGVTLTPDRCIPSTQITLSLNIKDKGENAYIYDTKITVVNDANPRNADQSIFGSKHRRLLLPDPLLIYASKSN